MRGNKNKTYASTYIYSKKDENGVSTEQTLVEFIMKAKRINKVSPAMAQVLNMVKERQKTAVIYRMLMDPDVVLCVAGKELPASFKVFYAKDIRITPENGKNQRPKIFIDCTGLITENNGYFGCKSIDTLCAYLFDAVAVGTYYMYTNKIMNNNSICRLSASCYTKMFSGVLDNLRVINYIENKDKIRYIICVYFLFNILQKDIKSAQTMAASILSLSGKEASAWDIYYDEDKDFERIDTFIAFLENTFGLKGLTPDVVINKWLTLFGKGSLYGIELYTAFISILINAYSGAYINRQNVIENMCGRELATLCESLLRTGSECFNKGFKYDENMRTDMYYANN